jgi:hypothetical protein
MESLWSPASGVSASMIQPDLSCGWKGMMKKSRCGLSEDQIDKPRTDSELNSMKGRRISEGGIRRPRMVAHARISRNPASTDCEPSQRQSHKPDTSDQTTNPVAAKIASTDYPSGTPLACSLCDRSVIQRAMRELGNTPVSVGTAPAGEHDEPRRHSFRPYPWRARSCASRCRRSAA